MNQNHLCLIIRIHNLNPAPKKYSFHYSKKFSPPAREPIFQLLAGGAVF
jgi:hypothetical protein